MRRLLALVALTLVSSGCGPAEKDPNLAEAIDQTEATGSSLIAVEATGSDGEITCVGAADYEHRRLRLACDSAAGGYAMVAIGDTTYMRGDLLGIASGWRQVAEVHGRREHRNDVLAAIPPAHAARRE